MGRLEDELSGYNIKGGAEKFREVIADVKNGMCRNWTDEDLLCHPVDAIRFCAAVCGKLRCFDLPDDLILRTLLNMRKASDPRLDKDKAA